MQPKALHGVKEKTPPRRGVDGFSLFVIRVFVFVPCRHLGTLLTLLLHPRIFWSIIPLFIYRSSLPLSRPLVHLLITHSPTLLTNPLENTLTNPGLSAYFPAKVSSPFAHTASLSTRSIPTQQTAAQNFVRIGCIPSFITTSWTLL